MAGMGEDIRERTDALDAAGNTTAAIGKGYAIGSAALVSLALFGAYVTRADITTKDSSILDPEVRARASIILLLLLLLYTLPATRQARRHADKLPFKAAKSCPLLDLPDPSKTQSTVGTVLSTCNAPHQPGPGPNASEHANPLLSTRCRCFRILKVLASGPFADWTPQTARKACCCAIWLRHHWHLGNCWAFAE